MSHQATALTFTHTQTKNNHKLTQLVMFLFCQKELKKSLFGFHVLKDLNFKEINYTLKNILGNNLGILF